MESLVSIIIPAYNAERFIRETIESVQRQNYNCWELIIVNDGSIDSTKAIVEKLMSTDKRITLINQKNMGVSVARNTGLNAAKGDFLALLDADDIWLKNNLSEKVSMLLNEATIDFVFSDLDLVDESSQKIICTLYGSDVNIFDDMLLWEQIPIPNPCSNIVFRKSCLSQNIFFPHELSNIADKYFAAQLSKYFKGKRIAAVLLKYRMVGGSMSKNIRLHETDTIKAYVLYEKLGFFKSNYFKRKCFSNMFLIIAGSWWKNGKNKTRALYFLLRAFFTDPLNTGKKIFLKFFTAQS